MIATAPHACDASRVSGISSKNTIPRKTPTATGRIYRWVPVNFPLFPKKNTPTRERREILRLAMNARYIVL